MVRNKTKRILNKFINNLLAYILVIGIFTIAIGFGFRGKYKAPGELNKIIIITGVVIVLPFILYILYFYLIQKKKKIARTTDNIIQNPKKKDINLSEVKILSYNNKKIDYYDTFIGQSEIQSSKKQVNNVVIEIPFKNKKIEYSFNTTKNLQNLKIYFSLEQKTTLFIDNNGNIIYMDLVFLQ